MTISRIAVFDFDGTLFRSPGRGGSSRERREKGAAVLSALLDANDATEAKRKAMHATRQTPRGEYRNKK